MSPASKSKSKDKKTSKEPQKGSLKPSGPATAGNSIPASAYNPLSGTFHTIETVPVSSASPILSNGRFKNIDENEENSVGSHGGGEYDSVSNNGSWSGESEDHKGPHPHVQQETVPGAGSEKREKIRQKNERKHQRQKEKRAQELHERCSGYLMSRKLEALAQQLVAMGFSQERATMALILNEGKVEQSVAWLFEEGEEADKHKDQNISGGHLKIDISEELARIAEMEMRYSCTKQEVERAVVASEGDLEKAAEALRASKQDPPRASPKPEETGDPSTSSTVKLPLASNQNSGVSPQVRPIPPVIQQRRDEKEFNYTKTVVAAGVSPEFRSKNVQPLKKIQPKLEWAKPQQQSTVPAEKRWLGGASNPSISYSLASTFPASSSPTVKTETRYMTSGSEVKNLQPSVKEPVIMMQRAQSLNAAKQIPATTISSLPLSSPTTAAGWYPSSSSSSSTEMKSNGFMPHIPNTVSLSPNNTKPTQMYNQLHYQPQQRHFIPSSSTLDSPATGRGNCLWSRTGGSPTLAAASSLGLFTSTGSSGASSPVDWSSGGSTVQLDYANIDWSLDRGLTSPRSSGLWLGRQSLMGRTQMYDLTGTKPVVRSGSLSGSGVVMGGLQDGDFTGETSGAGSHEWTSPFEGKDMFRLPRQFVFSPSL